MSKLSGQNDGQHACDFPTAVAVNRSRWRMQLVWLVPLVAILIAGWLAARSIMQQGPTITIRFGMNVGTSQKARRDFVGLESPPALASGAPGREFVLKSGNIGSLDIGSPVFFRRLQVGQIVSYALDPDGAGMTIHVFINAPYDKYVTNDTRFWHASGVDVTLDATGVKVDTDLTQKLRWPRLVRHSRQRIARCKATRHCSKAPPKQCGSYHELQPPSARLRSIWSAIRKR